MQERTHQLKHPLSCEQPAYKSLLQTFGRICGALRELKRVLNAPLNQPRRSRAFLRFLTIRMATRMLRAPLVIEFVNEKRLMGSWQSSLLWDCYQCGLPDFGEMGLLLHALRDEDLFVDIGANMGLYTILAGAVLGAHCMSFEPTREAFEELVDNINLNRVNDRVVARMTAVGNASGIVRFIADSGLTNHIEHPAQELKETVEVPIVRLDDLPVPPLPFVMKIDVEGFEYDVILGSKRLLERDNCLALIVETNILCRNYGHERIEIHGHLVNLGFHPYDYLPFERRIVPLATFHPTGNTIYVRNPSELRARIANSRKFQVHGHLL